MRLEVLDKIKEIKEKSKFEAPLIFLVDTAEIKFQPSIAEKGRFSNFNLRKMHETLENLFGILNENRNKKKFILNQLAENTNSSIFCEQFLKSKLINFFINEFK